MNRLSRDTTAPRWLLRKRAQHRRPAELSEVDANIVRLAWSRLHRPGF